MNIDNAQKFLIDSGKSDLAKMLFYDTETRTCTELMATLLEEYHQSEVLKLNIHNVIVPFVCGVCKVDLKTMDKGDLFCPDCLTKYKAK